MSDSVVLTSSGPNNAYVLGIELTIDNNETPANLLFRFSWQPLEGNTKTLIFTHFSNLRSVVPDAQTEGNTLQCKWTEKTKPGIVAWLETLKNYGFGAEAIDRALGLLNKVALSYSRPIFSIWEGSYGPIPRRRLIQLQGLEKAAPQLWSAISSIPGAFFVLPSGRSSPVSSSLANQIYDVHKIHPSPVFIPSVHIDMVAQIVGTNDVEYQRTRMETGLDYRIFPPQMFPVPGVNSETGRPYSLFPFQAQAVSKALAAKRCLWQIPVGGGKTLCSLAWAESLFRANQIDRCIIVAPRRLIPQWVDYLGMYYHKTGVELAGPPKTRAKKYTSATTYKSQYLFTRYDTWRLPDADMFLGQFLGPRTAVIIDEVHHLKHQNTKRFEAISRLLNGIRRGPKGLGATPQIVNYRLLMTGTIVHDKPTDIFGPVHLLGLNVWNSLEEYERRYFFSENVMTNRIGRDGRNVVKSRVTRLNPAKVPELQQIMANIGYNISQDDMGLQLPPLRRAKLPVYPTEQEAKVYSVIRGEVERLVNTIGQAGGDIDISRKAQESLFATISMERQFSCDPALLLISPSPAAAKLRDSVGTNVLLGMSPGSKMLSMLSWVASYLSQSSGKVVVFTSFQKVFPVVQALMRTIPAKLEQEDKEALAILRSTCLFFSGEMTDTEGAEVIRQFKTNPRYRVLISTDAGGEGQNFQSVANCVVHFDQPFSLGALEQREGRVYRQGQKYPVLIVRMLFAPQEELVEATSNALKQALRNSRYVDPRLKAMLEWKGSEKLTVLTGL